MKMVLQKEDLIRMNNYFNDFIFDKIIDTTECYSNSVTKM